MANKIWDEATAAATAGMPEQGARERRRHARNFATWTHDTGLDPDCADRAALEAYLAALPGSDPQRQAKARSALRAVLREIDVDGAARVAGLGNQLQLLENLPEGLSALVEVIVGRQPKRRPVIASALTRLFAWCREVDADPLGLSPTDLPQFRRWLVEVATTVRETVVVAGDFVAFRHSPAGRELLGERISAHRLVIDGYPLMPKYISPPAPARVGDSPIAINVGGSLGQDPGFRGRFHGKQAPRESTRPSRSLMATPATLDDPRQDHRGQASNK
jgi:hypothetical protein